MFGCRKSLGFVHTCILLEMTKKGRTARMTSVSFQPATKAITSPATIVAVFWKISDTRCVVTPCTRVASVNKFC